MPEVTILKIGRSVIVPIQVELHDRAARDLQMQILNKIEETGAAGLIIDISALQIIDSFLGRILGEVARMARLLGAVTILVGMKKEVVITLIQLGMNLDDLHSALDLEDALVLMDRLCADPKKNT